MNKRYLSRGVSAQKEDVHKATQNLYKGLYPKAFCKVYPDYLNGDEDYCNIIHSDGSGTKSLLAYLYWKETEDLSVWKGIAQDALVMNTDDLLGVGITDGFIYSSIINRNKHLIPGEVIQTIIEGTQDFIENMASFGVNINFLGGETADLGDLVRTITVDGTMACRPLRKDIITNEKIQDGDVIVAFASYGKATYENQYNSGIGSNGLTSARHDVLHKYIARKYPEALDPNTPSQYAYSGSKKITDDSENDELNVGQLLLSPTRTYLPLVKEIFAKHKENIHGIIHCTGGAQTKVLHYVDNLHVIKNNLLPIPEIFQLISKESKTGWKEMYEVFNMGHRLEMYVPASIANKLIDIAASFEIDAAIIGKVKNAEGKKLTLESEFGTFEY
jgi:phosphoribosylformylglycinamidine cyclo-ligase